MPNAIGERFDKGLPKVLDDKPQRGFFTQIVRLLMEIIERLETPIEFPDPPDDPLLIANGGTGQVTAGAAFAALSPTTTKGDIIADDGTDPVRVPAGTEGYRLAVSSAAAAGVAWVNPDTHGDRVLMIQAAAGECGTSGGCVFDDAAGRMRWTSSGASGGTGDQVIFSLPLRVGDRIKSCKAYGRTFDGNNRWSLALFKVAMASNTHTQLGSTQTTTASAADDDDVTVGSLTETVAAGTTYYARWSTSGTGTDERRCYGLELTFDHP